jgi:hypothetical protein
MAARTKQTSAGGGRARNVKAKTKGSTANGRPPSKKGKKTTGAGKPRRSKSQQPSQGAADAIAGLLESPLVADVLAAGAAAALASFTHHSLSRKAEGGSKQALKDAAKAAASAMGTRLAAEFDEIIKAAEESRSEEA